VIPPYERCPKLPTRSTIKFTGEHVVQDSDVAHDGTTYYGWCKFCGESVYAESDEDHWHPFRPYYIQEEWEPDIYPQS
jgi:hypothetical protein